MARRVPHVSPGCTVASLVPGAVPIACTAGSRLTAYASTERPTATNDERRDRARDSQTPWRLRSPRTRGCFSRAGSVAGASLAASLGMSWAWRGALPGRGGHGAGRMAHTWTISLGGLYQPASVCWLWQGHSVFQFN